MLRKYIVSDKFSGGDICKEIMAIDEDDAMIKAGVNDTHYFDLVDNRPPKDGKPGYTFLNIVKN